MIELFRKLFFRFDYFYRISFICIMGLAVFVSVFEVFGLGLLSQVILSIINPESEFLKIIPEWALPQDLLFFFCIFFSAGILIRLGFIYLLARISFGFSHHLVDDLSRVFFTLHGYVEGKSIPNDGPEFLAVCSAKMDAVSKSLIGPLAQSFSSLIMIIFACGFLVFEFGLHAAILIGAIALFYLGFNASVRPLRKSSAELISSAISKELQIGNEFMLSWREILCFRGGAFFHKKFIESDYVYRHRQGVMQFLNQAPKYVLEGLGVIILVGFGSYAIDSADTEAGRATVLNFIIVFGVVVVRMLPIVQQFYASVSAFFVHIRLVSDVFDLLDKFDQSKPKGIADAGKPVSKSWKYIEISDLSLPDEGGRRLFDNLSFQIARGEIIALVGPSGSGKSSVFDWLCGYRGSITGSLAVDGRVIRWNHMHWAQENVSLVTQSPSCIAGTVLENIGLVDSLNSTTSDRTEISVLAKELGLSDLIEELGGLDANLFGAREGISGGQLQRLALMRALYSKKSLLLLDEFVSGLDETKLNDLLPRFFKLVRRMGYTVLITSHNICVTSMCDRSISIQRSR